MFSHQKSGMSRNTIKIHLMKSLKADFNEGWPECAHYMPVAPGSCNINLKAQPKHMKLVLKSAIAHIMGTTSFKTAFPPLDSEESWEHYHEILIKCAKHLGNIELLERFKQDDHIVVASA